MTASRKKSAHPDRVVSLLPRLKRDRGRAAPELLPALADCTVASAGEPVEAEFTGWGSRGQVSMEELSGPVNSVL